MSDPVENRTTLTDGLRNLRNGWNDPTEVIDLAQRAATEIERLRRAVAFARSTIKSGEPWTETCERELRVNV